MDDEDEKTGVTRMFFDASGKPITCPAGTPVHWRVSSYGFLEDEDCRILLVVPTWSPLFELPGGGLEIYETLDQGIRREVYEETGYRVRMAAPLPLYVGESNFFLSAKSMFCHSVFHVYHCELIHEERHSHVVNTFEDKNEIARVEWVAPSDLRRSNLHPMHHPLLDLLGRDD